MYNCKQCKKGATKIRRLIIDGNKRDCYYRVVCSSCNNRTAWVDSITIAVQLWNASNYRGNVGGTDDDTR